MKFSKLIIVLAGMLCFSSCGTDDLDNPVKKAPEPKASVYYPLKAGNYWVYKLYETYPDTNIEKFVGTDSIYVNGTKVFGSDTFWQVSYNSTFFNQKDDYKYYKDSAGYLIEKPGTKKLSIDNFRDTLFSYDVTGGNPTIPDFARVRRYMNKYEGEKSTPAGVFDSIINLQQVVHLAKPNTYEDYPRLYDNLYAKGIGKVYYEFGYLGARMITECRLVEYKID